MAAAPTERLVLVHDWLTGMRGGEKCLESAARHWPEAPLYSLIHKRGSVSAEIEQLRPRTSFLNRLPRVEQYYRWLLPLMPLAMQMRLPACDLVLSFSHCVAKAVVPPQGVPHVSYCFSPMRYAWHMQEAYFGTNPIRGNLKARTIATLMEHLREWDRATAERVTHFVAISRAIQRRIRECYDRDSLVIYPPVNTDYYTPTTQSREEFYLVVSAFAPYKRLDLAVEACTRLGKRLVVIGQGQDAARLRSKAGPTVRFLGWQPDEVLREHYRTAKALLFPGEEDFGIVPVEAQACGCPVIVYGRGGNLETVRPTTQGDATGLFFEEQTVDAMVDAIARFEQLADRLDPRAARRHAQTFRKQRYEDELFGYLRSVMRGTDTKQRQAA